MDRIEVTKVPTPDMPAFIATVKQLPDRVYARVHLTSFDFVSSILTVKLCHHYFPTVEWVRDATHANGWRCVRH
jgi:hypothetical protein